MRRGRARGGFARRTPMASAPCHLLELPTAVLLLIADAASHRSVGRLAQASHLCWAQLCADLVTKRIPYDARMVLRKSAWRHAMLFGGPCPFQAVGRGARCARCGTCIRATVEDPHRVMLFADMLRHVQLEHTAEFAPFLSSTSTHENNPASREVYGYDPCRCLAGGLDVHSCASCATHGPASYPVNRSNLLIAPQGALTVSAY